VQAVEAYLRHHFPDYLTQLSDFARLASVSTDPAYRSQLLLAAHWVAQRMEGAGFPVVEIWETAGHPVVYGERLVDPGLPTLLVYGHYDVQPPDPLDRWTSPPFEPQVREVDGEQRLYARGVSDDKGPMLIPILVAEAFARTQTPLPVNLKFLLEGEEEIGSPHLEDLISQNQSRLGADLVLSADGAMWRPGVTSLNISSRGSCALELTVTGPARDLHSGRHGGAVLNPLVAISHLVASLHHPDGRVAVEGFYREVGSLSPQEYSALQRLPWDDAGYLQEVGAPALWGEPGYGTLERHWVRPTLEVTGMWGGYTGPGGKTVIPSQAHAKISCRLVPDQDPAVVLQRVVDHLRQLCPPQVTLEVHTEGKGAFPYAIPADHWGLEVARRVLTQLEGQPPLEVRIGGTLPIAQVFHQVLGLEMVFFSFSTGDEDFHAPNEFFRLKRFELGLQAWARYWQLAAQFIPQR
jgi:acetylornithine deacetylase/succinyl-diaminopimelate desuccinylase-like protein